MLELLKIFLIKQAELVILVEEGLEKAFQGAPFNRVTQLEVAHAFTLNALEAEVINRSLVRDGETMGVVDGGKSQLDVEVVRAER